MKTMMCACAAALGLTLAVGTMKAEMTPLQPATGLVDLTGAAESSVNSVVYIKVVTGGQTQTVTVQDPFDDFFGDFFGRYDFFFIHLTISSY